MHRRGTGIVVSSWKEETPIPIYYVTKSSKYGTFTCSVKPCPHDYNNINDWDGYRFAERKCDIAIMHAKTKVLKERAFGIKVALNALINKYENTATPHIKFINNEGEQCHPEFFIKDLKYQLEVAEKEYQIAYNKYKYMKNSFSDFTTRMTEKRKQIQQKLKK